MTSDQDLKKKGRFFMSNDHFSVEYVSDSLFSVTLSILSRVTALQV